MAAASSGGGGLVATYAAMQSNLRKQFYGDLVDLRGALLNTMSVAPHRASSLHVKMHLIDSALHMLEESKESVSNAEMAQLMNMSAKVARAVEAWRARKPQLATGAPPAPEVPAQGGSAGSRFATPFGVAEVQVRPDPAAATAGLAGGKSQQQSAGTSEDGDGSAADRWDFLSQLVAGPAAESTLRTGKTLTLPLPDIDWDVPEIKPSGNLDAMLPSAGGGSDGAQQQQQRQAAALAAGAPGAPRTSGAHPSRPARVSSAEVFLARMSAQQADDSGGGGGADSVCQPSPQCLQPPQQQHGQHSRGVSLPLQRRERVPSPAAGAVAAPGLLAAATGAGVTSPPSAATSCQQPEGSCSGGGGSRQESAGAVTTGGSVGNPAGSTCPSPGLGQQQQQQQGMPLGPFGSLMLHRASPSVHGADAGVGGFGSMQVLPQSAAFGAMLPAQQQQQQQAGMVPSYASASSNGLGVNGASVPAGMPTTQFNSASLLGMQQLGLSSSSTGAGFVGTVPSVPQPLSQQAQQQQGFRPMPQAVLQQAQQAQQQGYTPMLQAMLQQAQQQQQGFSPMPQLLSPHSQQQQHYQQWQASSPVLPPNSSFTQQQAAAAAAAAAQQQQQAGRPPLPQPMHAGSGGLGSLLGGGDSGNYQQQAAAALYASSSGNFQLQQQHSGKVVSSGAPPAGVGFSAVPVSNCGTMGGLTITTGGHTRIRITAQAGNNSGPDNHAAFYQQQQQQEATQQQVAFDGVYACGAVAPTEGVTGGPYLRPAGQPLQAAPSPDLPGSGAAPGAASSGSLGSPGGNSAGRLKRKKT